MVVGKLVGISAAAACVAVLVMSACSAIDAGQEHAFNTEADPCLGCQAKLTDCASQSVDDTTFIACRDQFLACQQAGALAIGECGKPKDDFACSMCRDRYELCQASDDASSCSQQFSACRSRLLTRQEADISCEAEPLPTADEGCQLCKSGFASCMFDASGSYNMAICSDIFFECTVSNQVDFEQCAVPNGEQACELCIAQHDDCVAGGGSDCDIAFDACATGSASDVICTVTNSSGAGGSDGGTEPPPVNSCAHSECEEGVALEASCSECAFQVCEGDEFCCSTEWDVYCTEAAAAVPACNCE